MELYTDFGTITLKYIARLKFVADVALMAVSAVTKTIILVAVGLILAISGLLSYLMFPRILQWQVEEVKLL